MAIAIAPFFAFTYLDLIGFDSTPGAINSPEQILGLKILFCFGLPLFLLLTILCIRNYPITQENHLFDHLHQLCDKPENTLHQKLHSHYHQMEKICCSNSKCSM